VHNHTPFRFRDSVFLSMQTSSAATNTLPGIECTLDNGVFTICLNRPEKRNALSAELIASLHSAFVYADAQSTVKVVLVKANGNAFCSGADLATLQTISTMSAMENLADSTALQRMFRQIEQCSKPIVASVQGWAIAGGCGLASLCDIVVACHEHARFGYSEVRIGFVPAIVMVYLIRKVGDTMARRLMLTAEVISASEAHAMGLVSYVAPPGQLQETTHNVVQTLLANSGSAMALTKHMFSAVAGMSVDAALQYAATMNALARQTDDCKNGIATFLSKNNEKL
jgi:methylglutaconyl-CoA hydratase